jgi:hypothetical protein
MAILVVTGAFMVGTIFGVVIMAILQVGKISEHIVDKK